MCSDREDPIAAFLAAADPNRRDELQQIVDAIRAAGPWQESVKWSNPFFALDGHAVLKLYVASGWTNVYFYRGAELPDPDGALLTDDTVRMRKLRLERDSAIDRETVTRLAIAARALEEPAERR